MIRDENTYPVDTVVRIRETGEFAIIKKVCFLMDSQNFQHYLAGSQGKEFRSGVEFRNLYDIRASKKVVHCLYWGRVVEFDGIKNFGA